MEAQQIAYDEAVSMLRQSVLLLDKENGMPPRLYSYKELERIAKQVLPHSVATGNVATVNVCRSVLAGPFEDAGGGGDAAGEGEVTRFGKIIPFPC